VAGREGAKAMMDGGLSRLGAGSQERGSQGLMRDYSSILAVGNRVVSYPTLFRPMNVYLLARAVGRSESDRACAHLSIHDRYAVLSSPPIWFWAESNSERACPSYCNHK
jgi:hypothetical protein